MAGGGSASGQNTHYLSYRLKAGCVAVVDPENAPANPQGEEAAGMPLDALEETEFELEVGTHRHSAAALLPQQDVGSESQRG